VLRFKKLADAVHVLQLLSEEDAEDRQGGHRPGGEAAPGLGKGAGTMSDERFASVWDAIEDTPAAAKA
jgi:hypothetical protein